MWHHSKKSLVWAFNINALFPEGKTIFKQRRRRPQEHTPPPNIHNNYLSVIIVMTTFCERQCHNCKSLCNLYMFLFCSFQVLVCRNYRGDVDMSEIEHFMTLLMDKEEEGTLSPILAHGGVRFMWIKHNNLYCILLHCSPSVTVQIYSTCLYFVSFPHWVQCIIRPFYYS